MFFTSYILQKDNFSEPRVVMIGPGYGLEINDNRVLTALHVAVKMDYPILFADMEKDIAIIEINHGNDYSLKFVNSQNAFIFIETVPQPGESGKPHMADGNVLGVIIGESSGYGIVASLDESIIRQLNRK